MNKFVIADPEKCIGCKACEIACAVAHLDVSVASAQAMDVPFVPRLNLIRTSNVTMPVQCRQCDDAPCANVCPVEAIIQKDGINTIIPDKCIGCKKCMIACPFGMIDIQPKISNGEPETQDGLQLETSDGKHEKALFVIHKCDFCAGRANGPACIEVCPANAITIADQKVIMESIRQKRLEAALDIAGKRRVRM